MLWHLSIATSVQAASAGSLPPAIELPPGFALEKAATLEDSLLSIAFDERGRPYVGVERKTSRRLFDADGDGLCETSEPFAPSITSAQCLLFRGEVCFATGIVAEKAGVFRIELDQHGEATSMRCLVPVDCRNEHGVHQLAFGPDGDLFAMFGDHTRMPKPPRADSPLQNGLDGNALPILPDPSGHGNECLWPFGFVARIDPETGAWSYHSVGYRNAYDLAFDREGELFTCDSDMEWDVGLPWYRPVRVLHSVFLGDYGSRRGSFAMPEEYPDTLPWAATIGRGSPTGVGFATKSNWPAPWCDSFLVADWALAKIDALQLRSTGATYTGEVTTFAQGTALGSITDFAFSPRGDLWFVRGGRATVGNVQRIAWHGAKWQRPPSMEGTALRAHQRVASLAELEMFVTTGAWPSRRQDVLTPQLVRRAVEAIGGSTTWIRSKLEFLYQTLGHSDRHTRWAARAALDRLPDDDLAPLVSRLQTESDATRALELVQLLAQRRELVKEQVLIEGPLLGRMKDILDGNLPGQELVRPLRLLQLVRSIQGEPKQGPSSRNPVPFAMTLPADAPATARRLVAELKAQSMCCSDELLRSLETTPDRADAIHSARCAAASSVTPTVDEAVRFFLWFDATAAWKGGVNYRGYLDEIRVEFFASLRTETVLEAARRSAFTPSMIAWFVRMLPPERSAELVTGLRAAYAALAHDGPGLAQRRDVLEALQGTRSAEAREWLREIASARNLDRAVALRILAHDAEAGDLELLVEGLGLEAFGTPSACAEAIVHIERSSDDAAVWSRTLDAACYLQHPGGWAALRAIAHWAGSEPPTLRPDDWASELERMEAAYSKRFPGQPRSAANTEMAPNWSHERLAAIVTNAAARGSASRGRGVFERTTCDRCHVVGTAYQGTTIQRGTAGPDLLGVSKRFSDAQILETMLFPSRAISDQYRAFVITTKDELLVEGRLLRETASELEVLRADGSTILVARDEIESRADSKLSQMPDGLLARIPIEDVLDLFAFLRADGRVEHVDPEWKPMFEAGSPDEWAGDRDVWKLDHGTLVGRGMNLARSSYLVSKATYRDFECEFDVRISRGGNSGLQYRSSIDPTKDDPLGYQADVGQTYWGALYESAGRGILHEADPFTWRRVVDPTGWNHYRVLVDGDRHVIEVNGVVLTDMRDALFADGHVALQVHQGLEMDVRFANARMRLLR